MLTHSHSRVVHEILALAAKEMRRFTVIVPETRPSMQGTMMAEKLQSLKIPVTVIPDAALELLDLLG